jgi:hypothetical protein
VQKFSTIAISASAGSGIPHVVQALRVEGNLLASLGIGSTSQPTPSS